jgi:[lysine-biosynthesis-protein LysW]---L-2-aminoadipate ligase
MKLAILHSTVRKEEKLIHQAALSLNVESRLVDIRSLNLNPDTFIPDFDIALERSLSTIKGGYVSAFLESLGLPVINSPSVASLCEDKYLTSLRLKEAGLPVPRFALAFNLKTAEAAVRETGGYPSVLKPARGSWGRLLAKVNDQDSLEALLEHKEVLGTPPQKAFYIQEYVEKPERDIRAFVIGGVVICAIYRNSPHWITNTAKGGSVENCPVTPDLNSICLKAANAVGGGILAIDLLESDQGLLVNEINHTMEFRNSEEPTGISISDAIVNHCLKVHQNPERKKRGDV